MTLLVIQIPCYNEAQQLPATLAALPRAMAGIDRVEWLIVDDGSTDETADVARRHGADHVIRLVENRGLARAFSCGLEAALRAGADIVVNTDADNQYCADDIERLVAPIVASEAQMVVGTRPISKISEFSIAKKVLQRVGSAVVRLLSGVNVVDATSGFRAFTRDVALKLNVFSEYTYTLETLIQAGQRGFVVTSVPIRVNAPVRSSRLMATTASYVLRSMLSIIRALMVYRPFRFLSAAAVFALITGAALSISPLEGYLNGNASRSQTLLLLASLSLVWLGVSLAIAALVADLIAINRRLLEELQTAERVREWRPR